MNTTLTICVPSLRPEKLSRLVKSIEAFTPNLAYEIIACGPPEISDACRHSKHLRILCEPEPRGVCMACEDILHEARGKYFVYLSDDCVVTRGWARAMLTELQLQKHEKVCVSPVVLVSSDIAGGELDREMIPLRVPDGEYSIFPMLRTDWLKALGGFLTGYNTWFFDPDLGMRIYRDGGTVAHCSNAVILHEIIPTDERDARVNENWQKDFEYFTQRWGIGVLF